MVSNKIQSKPIQFMCLGLIIFLIPLNLDDLLLFDMIVCDRMRFELFESNWTWVGLNGLHWFGMDLFGRDCIWLGLCGWESIGSSVVMVVVAVWLDWICLNSIWFDWIWLGFDGICLGLIGSDWIGIWSHVLGVDWDLIAFIQSRLDLIGLDLIGFALIYLDWNGFDWIMFCLVWPLLGIGLAWFWPWHGHVRWFDNVHGRVTTRSWICGLELKDVWCHDHIQGRSQRLTPTMSSRRGLHMDPDLATPIDLRSGSWWP